MGRAIYLDHNATTPVDARVLEEMLPYFREHFGNAASHTHAFGWIAADAVKKARSQVAGLIGAEEQEIAFTSGSTEAINLGIKGVFDKYKTKGNHIVTVQTEHKAVLDTCKALELTGAEITYLPVNPSGEIDLTRLADSITSSTILVCVMHANNETGLIHPIEKIGKIISDKKSLFFCDATQSAGKMMLDVKAARIALLALSAHKLYGPKGTGALYVSRKEPRVQVQAQMHGGGHERGLRSGTLNVPGIVGFGKACELCKAEMWEEGMRLSKLRTKLEQYLLDLGQVYVNGGMRDRLPNTCNLSIAGIRADRLIAKLTGIALATGSACTSALPEPSHVLKAMGLHEELALSAVRFSLGRENSEEEIDYTIREMSKVIHALRTDR